MPPAFTFDPALVAPEVRDGMAAGTAVAHAVLHHSTVPHWTTDASVRLP
ncbi:hypothetical protein ACFVX6_17240 [Streptomyces sp. NPDC058289]